MTMLITDIKKEAVHSLALESRARSLLPREPAAPKKTAAPKVKLAPKVEKSKAKAAPPETPSAKRAKK